jgi:multiple sugar transport system permease protein
VAQIDVAHSVISEHDPGRKPRLKSVVREALLGYLFIIPSLIIVLVFSIFPLFRAFYMSFHDWSIVKGKFVGLMNYQSLLQDPDFGQSIQVTVFYVIATVPLTMLLSLLIAYLLFRPIRARAMFRTLYFLPYVTSVVPAAMVWQWIFNSQSGILNTAAGALSQQFAKVLNVLGSPPWVYVGLALMVAWLIYLLSTIRKRTGAMTWFLAAVASFLLLLGVFFALYPAALQNTAKQLETFFPVRWLQEPRGIFLYLGRKWGFTPPTWLQGPSMALVAVSIVSMWHFIGYDVVIYLAGFFNVPTEVLEAARIDGASEGQTFWKITFPLLSPTTFFLLIISTIGAFRAFTMFFVLTAGGPLRTTMSVTYLVYDKFYTANRWGYASAIAFVLFAIILAMTLLNQRLAARRVFYQ